MNTLENPTLYREKWGLPRSALFFLFWLRNVDCGYSLEPPHRGGSNKYPQSMFGAKSKENTVNFHLINAISRFMQFCIVLYR